MNFKQIEQTVFNHLSQFKGIYTIILFVVLFINSCSTSAFREDVKQELAKTQAQVERQQAKIDSLEAQMLTKPEIETLLYNVPMWETLRIEKLADETGQSITQLRSKWLDNNKSDSNNQTQNKD